MLHSRLRARLGVGLLLLASAPLPARVAAEPSRAPLAEEADWERTSLPGPVSRCSPQPAGRSSPRSSTSAIGATTPGPPGGPVPLPPAPKPTGRSRFQLRQVAVDPTNRLVLYVEGAEGLYQSPDDARTWRLILPTILPVLRIAVSPADPRIV